jgi:large subunit ribosomal protein L18
MDRLIHKKLDSHARAKRTRARITGSAERPRLSVSISNMHISAQIIDDSRSITLVSATTIGQKTSGNMIDKAIWVGTEIAKNAKKAKLKSVVFDRGARKYHGRIKALADAARKEGLEF